MILVRLMGGLGNQMFQYACGLRLAEKHHTELKIDLTLLLDRSTKNPHAVWREFDLAEVFHVSAPLANEKEIAYFNPNPQTFFERVANKVRQIYSPPRVFIQSQSGFDSTVPALPDNYCLVGQFQSEKFFFPAKDKVREEFSFKHALLEKETDLAEEIQKSNSVCINVRRGDYVTNPIYSKSLGFVGLPYYKKSISLISNKDQELKLFVFSDEVEWCKKHFDFPLATTFVSHDYAGPKFRSYFQLMSLCKHFVIPNSTFAWWAAWLGQREGSTVIAPARWSADGSQQSSDRIPPHWIQIS